MEMMKKSLKKQGIESFTAKHDIKYGSSQSESIKDAIKNSNAFVVIITRDNPSLSAAQEVGFA